MLKMLYTGCVILLYSVGPAPDPAPTASHKAFSLMFRDSIPMEVELVFDTTGLPDYYLCHVNTPVCNDGLCRAMVLDVYWDLLGNFTRFEVPEFPPLTKWDHLEFTQEDYLKLAEILKDKESILGTVKDVNALFDPATKKVSDKVDAVTGATMATVRNAVVAGAVYSSYTLWHVVNGEIPPAIRQYTTSYSSPALTGKFLRSENYHYHYEALGYLVSTDYEGHFLELVEMLRKCSPFVSRRAMIKFPEAWIEKEQFQSAITREMDHLDYLAQEIWLDRLFDFRVYESTLDQLTRDTGRFSQQQLLQVLKLCDRNFTRLNDHSILRLEPLLLHQSEDIAQGTYQVFVKLGRKNKDAKKILKQYEKNHEE